MILLIRLIDFITRIIWIVVILDVILSYFMDPYHPLRRRLDSIVHPMLEPIRRVIPPISGIDISPIILLVLVQVVASLLKNLLLVMI
jgi:YggT family protein